MAKLSGWLFLIMGIIITTVSFLVNNATGKFKMALFVVLGVIFIFVGIMKIFTKKQKPQKKPRVVFCPYCGQSVYETQQFCHRCRSRLKNIKNPHV